MPPGRNRKSGKIVKKRISEILEKAYYDPKSVGSFGGVKRLLESIKTSHPDISVKEIRKWLRPLIDRTRVVARFRFLHRAFCKSITVPNNDGAFQRIYRKIEHCELDCLALTIFQ